MPDCRLDYFVAAASQRDALSDAERRLFESEIRKIETHPWRGDPFEVDGHRYHEIDAGPAADGAAVRITWRWGRDGQDYWVWVASVVPTRKSRADQDARIRRRNRLGPDAEIDHGGHPPA